MYKGIDYYDQTKGTYKYVKGNDKKPVDAYKANEFAALVWNDPTTPLTIDVMNPETGNCVRSSDKTVDASLQTVDAAGTTEALCISGCKGDPDCLAS